MMDEKEMKRKLYGLYQFDWMMAHGYSLGDVIKGLNDHIAVDHDKNIHDGEDGMYADMESIFSEWEGNVGFSNGCIYVCFDEFCAAELTDDGYIEELLNRVPWEDGLRDAYNKWLKVRRRYEMP